MNRQHGMAGKGKHSGAYKTWISMRQRCLYKSYRRWKDYGGRGITICARWSKFENFLIDMGARPDGYSIERIDNDGNYEPSNCRWATPVEQAKNRRNSRLFQFKGETRCLSEWARVLGFDRSLLRHRIDTLGWNHVEAFTLSVQTQGRNQWR